MPAASSAAAHAPPRPGACRAPPGSRRSCSRIAHGGLGEAVAGGVEPGGQGGAALAGFAGGAFRRAPSPVGVAAHGLGHGQGVGGLGLAGLGDAELVEQPRQSPRALAGASRAVASEASASVCSLARASRRAWAVPPR